MIKTKVEGLYGRELGLRS